MDWQYSKGMWRICEHGIQHPDPDHIEYEVLVNKKDRSEWSEHACDSCCGYSLSKDEWGVAGSVSSSEEAEDIAILLRLHDSDWYFNQIEGKLYVKRGQYRKAPVSKPKRRKKL